MSIKQKIMKAVLFSGLIASSISMANARTWSVEIEDDLFSETGKKAMLVSPGNFRPLIFTCDSSGIEFALLEKSQKTKDESSSISAPVTLVLKVDDEAPIRFSANLRRRNEHYYHASVLGKDYPEETVTALKQIQAAKSKILIGIMLGNDNNYSEAIGVSGSTATTTAFMKACGIKQ